MHCEYLRWEPGTYGPITWANTGSEATNKVAEVRKHSKPGYLYIITMKARYMMESVNLFLIFVYFRLVSAQAMHVVN